MDGNLHELKIVNTEAGQRIFLDNFEIFGVTEYAVGANADGATLTLKMLVSKPEFR